MKCQILFQCMSGEGPKPYANLPTLHPGSHRIESRRRKGSRLVRHPPPILSIPVELSRLLLSYGQDQKLLGISREKEMESGNTS